MQHSGVDPEKHILDTDAEVPGDAECAFERGRIAALLDRDNRLPGHADGLTEFSLGDAVVPLTQLANAVFEGKRPCHVSGTGTKQDYSRQILGQLAEHQASEDAIKQQIAVAADEINAEGQDHPGSQHDARVVS